MKVYKLIAEGIALLTYFSLASGVAGADFPRPTVVVSPSATIKGDKITLGDISRISYDQKEYSAVAEKLASIDLGIAPPPMASVTLIGANIITAIENAGIPRDTIGFSIPRAVVVERTGREVSKEEILNALRDKFSRKDILDIQVRDVSWNNAQVIPAGDTAYEIARLGEPAGGKVPLRIEVSVDGEPAARFLATAIADDWREIPVMSRTVERGMLVEPTDVQMVRLNLFKQPEDLIFKPDNVIGRRARNRLAVGDVIRASEVDVPPTVVRGANVTMTYNKNGLVATASGQALQDGFEGGLIQVKNAKSHRVLKARVKGPEQVEVIAE